MLWGGEGEYHSTMHGTYENYMHVSYNLNISSITRNNIVDNIMSLFYTSLLGLKQNPCTLLIILHVVSSSVIEPVTDCHD